MKKNPLVSIIIPTRNSKSTLDTCLKSVKNQTYKNIETIVVDNNSRDDTKKIAQKYTDLVFNKGPERSAQRNYGANKSTGDYLLFIDSDMELTEKVVEDCVKKIRSDEKIKALIIPEESFGEGFWAQCKALERSFYIGVDWIEAARFFSKEIFDEVGGYDENLISGEDFDLHLRVKKTKKGIVGRIQSTIKHNEGNPSLLSLLRKKFYYGKKIVTYQNKASNTSAYDKQANIITRYILFFRDPSKLLKNPIVGAGMLFLKTSEFVAGAIGLLTK